MHSFLHGILQIHNRTALIIMLILNNFLVRQYLTVLKVERKQGFGNNQMKKCENVLLIFMLSNMGKNNNEEN